MKAPTLAAMALLAATGASAFLLPTTQADAAPYCEFGFSTEQQTGWLLKCRKIVPVLQKGVALTQAGNANCNTDSYWNYGPAVTAKHLAGNHFVVVRYTCGHVEG